MKILAPNAVHKIFLFVVQRKGGEKAVDATFTRLSVRRRPSLATFKKFNFGV